MAKKPVHPTPISAAGRQSTESEGTKPNGPQVNPPGTRMMRPPQESSHDYVVISGHQRAKAWALLTEEVVRG